MPKAYPKRGHKNIIKHSFILQKQRYRCKSCTYQFTTTHREFGQSQGMKLMTVLLYVSSLSLNAIAKLFNERFDAIITYLKLPDNFYHFTISGHHYREFHSTN